MNMSYNDKNDYTSNDQSDFASNNRNDYADNNQSDFADNNQNDFASNNQNDFAEQNNSLASTPDFSFTGTPDKAKSFSEASHEDTKSNDYSDLQDDDFDVLPVKNEADKNKTSSFDEAQSARQTPPYQTSGNMYGQNSYQSQNRYSQPTYSNMNQGANRNQYSNQGTQTFGISYDKTNNGQYQWNYSTPKKKKGNGLAVFTSIVCVMFLCTAVALVGVLLSQHMSRSSSVEKTDTPVVSTQEEQTQPTVPSKKTETEKATPVVQPNPSVTGTLTIPQIAEKCKPSAVGIKVTVNSGFYGYTSSGVGSGFIISKDGYVATNHHVIENAISITVVLNDGTEHEGKLVGSDSVTDLAVIKIEAEDLPVAELGNSDEVVVGELAVAIGTPAGIEFSGTVTDGIISAINRDVEITDNYGRTIKTMTLIQTNATINPGNSGGPLINSRGQVIGINTLKLTSRYEGIGFSIPINSAVKIFNQLIQDGKVTDRDGSFVSGQGAIGITDYADITEREAEYYGIPQGVLVIQIQKDSSAAAAGLRRGDIITAFEGKKIKNVNELNTQKNKYKAGDEVTMTIYRDVEGSFDITFKLDMMQ